MAFGKKKSKGGGFNLIGKKTETSDYRVEKELYIGKNTRSATIKAKVMQTNSIGRVFSMPLPLRDATLADDDAAITVSNLQHGLLNITPTATRTKAIPSAADIISAMELTERYMSFEFSVINLNASNRLVLTMGGASTIAKGSLQIDGATSALFRVIVNNALVTELRLYRIS